MSRYICMLNCFVICDTFAKAKVTHSFNSSKLICMPYRFFCNIRRQSVLDIFFELTGLLRNS